MEREHTAADVIESTIDLGQASTETKGVKGDFLDDVLNLVETTGLTDD